MASNERTPLTHIPPGPLYVFPGVSPRTRRRQARQFQCCLCFLFSLIVFLAMIIAISYSLNEDADLNLPANETIILPVHLNDSELHELLLVLQYPLIDESVAAWGLPNPLMPVLIESERYGRKSLGDRELMEENLRPLPINTPSYRHQRAVGTSAQARKFAKRGYVETQATHFLAKKFGYKKTNDRSNIGHGPAISLLDDSHEVNCNMFTKYRSANGTCNNRNNAMTWGTAMQPFRRILQPDYGDGISSPRESHSKGIFPSARQVSLQVHRPSYSTDPNFNVMLAVWGQFMDHDITATALTQGADGEPIDCCTEKLHAHPECYPVPLGPGDPLYDNDNKTCMNFIRSAPSPTGRYGPREQLNQVTSFIDGSVVYGITEARQRSLRSNEKGRLRMFIAQHNRTLLPISTDPNDGCNEAEMNIQGKYCFEAGDSRANENLHLTSMHLLMARHHNYLATSLHDLNPHWSDEKTFQEARKILGAQMQHITYNEFLPILFGEEFTKRRGLLPNTTYNNDIYRKDVDASIGNGFAASAFRFAHTLLPGLIRATTNDTSEDYVLLHKMLFNPYSLWNEKGMDNALESAANTPLSRSDQFFTTELTQKLFEGKVGEKADLKDTYRGLDLVSLNIQRGRDHGLPAYYEWRRHCDLPEADTWEKMAYAVNNISLQNMKAVYNDSKDVDFYCGALSEPPIQDGILGPLLTCLISEQFWRIKHGDSHWYERTNGHQRFTNAQLDEIYKSSLAQIMCTNSDHIEEVQKFVMKKSDNSTNPIVQCTEIDEFDFTPWSSGENLVKIKTNSLESTVAVVVKNPTKEVENVTMKVLV